MAKVYIVHADWCPHCVASMPAFAEVMAKARRAGAGPTFRMVESKALAHPRYGEIRKHVSGFPTVFAWHRGRVLGVFQGPRTAPDILQWARGFSTKK